MGCAGRAQAGHKEKEIAGTLAAFAPPCLSRGRAAATFTPARSHAASSVSSSTAPLPVAARMFALIVFAAFGSSIWRVHDGARRRRSLRFISSVLAASFARSTAARFCTRAALGYVSAWSNAGAGTQDELEAPLSLVVRTWPDPGLSALALLVWRRQLSIPRHQPHRLDRCREARTRTPHQAKSSSVPTTAAYDHGGCSLESYRMVVAGRASVLARPGYVEVRAMRAFASTDGDTPASRQVAYAMPLRSP